MNESPTTQDTMPKLKTLITVIISTAVVVSAVWAFFFVRTMDLKNEQIAILKQSDPQALTRIESQLKSLKESIEPLALAFPFDEFDGRVGLGSGASGPTKITELLIESDNLRKDRKFDLALAKVDEIRNIRPTFAGAIYMQLLIEYDKGNEKETLRLAEQLIKQLPNDERILLAYDLAVKINLSLGNKKKAEEYCLSAIRLAPDDKGFRELFKSAFGYEPSVPMKE